jgi:hypothetical protein
LKKHEWPGSHQIPAKLIQAGGEILQSVIKKMLITFGGRKNCTISGRSPSLSLLSTLCKTLSSIRRSSLAPCLDKKLLGIITIGFNVTDQLVIRCFAFGRYWRQNWSTVRQYISYSCTSRKPMIQLGGKFLQYSYTVWGTHETRRADYNVLW